MAETGTTGGITAAMAETRKLDSPRRRAPDHPPYSVMIEEAIRSLAEAGGSTVVAIDRHIRSAHRDLPWGHRNLLPYYLGKLVAAGGIARTHSGRYSLGDGGPCCADAAPQPPPPPPPLPRTHSWPPPPKPSEGENGTPSPPYFSNGLPHEHAGGLGNGDLVEEGVSSAMLLPGHQKCALPQLSIRLLKRKLRDGNASFSSPSGGDLLASHLRRRRGRPPKSKAAIVGADDREEEGAAGHEGPESEAEFVGFSSPAGPTCSSVLRRRGRPPKRNDATVFKDEHREAGCGDYLKPSSPSPDGGSPAGFPVLKRRGRPPKHASAVALQVEQRETAAGDRGQQSEQMLVSSSSSIEDPVSPPVIKRRGRPPKPKAAMTLPDDGPHHESAAVVGQDGTPPELKLKLKLVAFASMGDPSSSAASPPIKRRGRPPKPKAEACREPERRKEDVVAQSCKEGTEFVLPGNGGTREEAWVGGQDAAAPPEGEQRVPAGRGLAGAVVDEGQADRNGPTCGKLGGGVHGESNSGGD